MTKYPDFLCIFHDNCADGFAAYWAVDQAFPGIPAVAADYKEAPPDVTDKHVIIVDFSYPKDVLLEMAETARSIAVIDHHKTAKAELKDFPELPGEGDLPGQDIHVLFDMEKSGCVMAWEYFHPDESVPVLLEHIQDRDLWKFEMEGSKEIHAALMSYTFDLKLWTGFVDRAPSSTNFLVREGEAILRRHLLDVDKLLSTFEVPVEIGGYLVPAANLPPTMASDGGHALAQRMPEAFAAIFWDTREGRTYSLRSVEGGMDVSKIAKQYGGGGHHNAAGFKVPFDHPLGRTG